MNDLLLYTKWVGGWVEKERGRTPVLDDNPLHHHREDDDGDEDGVLLQASEDVHVVLFIRGGGWVGGWVGGWMGWIEGKRAV